ncbi:MAG: TrbI/VirB10 family protein [Erythrobacter sp.]|nr:TrbI/VirB10 family protein [Erythrobacter sp.]NCQ22376.1 TrbI/VirB10 family protein [Sphingomonadales bacterium]
MRSEPETDQQADAEAITSLRSEGPRVVRLSRKAIGITAACTAVLIGGIIIYALQPQVADEQAERVNTEGVAVAEGLAAAPRDYTQVPKLGPPLPGDLGKPILDAQERGAVAQLPPIRAQPSPPQGVSSQDAARQRLEQERDAARSSRLFMSGGSPAAGVEERDPTSGLRSVAQQLRAAAPPPAFLERPADRRIASLEQLDKAPAAAILQAGSVIPAALITGIRSDQPGLVTALVTVNVYDSLTGRMVLIPQGSRLIGDYKSDTDFGQRRVLLAWNRLIFPDGRSIVLERQPASDPSGYAGLEDGVDYNWGGIAKAALVSTLLGIGAELGSGNDGDLARAFRRGGQDSINRAGEQIVGRELNIRPTLTIRPGFPVRVLVTRDIVMEGGS